MTRVKIEVLGTGCTKCTQLAENAGEAIAKLELDAELLKVQDIMEIAGRGVLVTPALAIDGVVKSSGRLLTADEIVGLLQAEG